MSRTDRAPADRTHDEGDQPDADRNRSNESRKRGTFVVVREPTDHGCEKVRAHLRNEM
jgi:hypothetical protein